MTGLATLAAFPHARRRRRAQGRGVCVYGTKRGCGWHGWWRREWAMLGNESKYALAVFRDSVPTSFFKQVFDVLNFMVACTVHNAMQDVVRHDISSSEVSEACNATEFDHASFAEGVEVSLKLKVDVVGFVVWYTAALRLLLIFWKIGARKIDELVWRTKLAANVGGDNFAPLTAPVQIRVAE
jgi:hypothetical protein